MRKKFSVKLNKILHKYIQLFCKGTKERVSTEFFTGCQFHNVVHLAQFPFTKTSFCLITPNLENIMAGKSFSVRLGKISKTEWICAHCCRPCRYRTNFLP